MTRLEAICIIAPNKYKITGTIKFTQLSHRCKIDYNIKNLSPGNHGFHIHEYGDLRDGCKSACAHFNPDNNPHGGPHNKNRHAGDLGNIISNNQKLAQNK